MYNIYNVQRIFIYNLYDIQRVKIEPSVSLTLIDIQCMSITLPNLPILMFTTFCTMPAFTLFDVIIYCASR